MSDINTYNTNLLNQVWIDYNGASIEVSVEKNHIDESYLIQISDSASYEDENTAIFYFRDRKQFINFVGELNKLISVTE